MDGFLERLMGKKPSSANEAKERLKHVLIHDRTYITPGQMENMKNELLQVISKNVNIYPKTVKINMTQDGREQRLVADIPIAVSSRK
jgi:cell division topological specificity factor